MAFRTNKMPILQEKSASGAVASFNTALAMPLPSCNIAVNAWQEGSGDPSPVNIRPIHGFSEVNATRAGKNLLDKRLLIQSPAVTQPYLCKFGVDDYYTSVPNGSIILASGQYTFSCIDKNDSSKNNTQLSVYDENGNNLYTRYTVKSMKFTVPKSMAVSLSINCGAGISFTSWDDYDIQLEAGSTATAYEPYITPTIYTIQLGQEVYGAEVDVVNGVAHVNYIVEQIDHVDTVLATYIKSDACDGFITLSNCPNIASGSSQYNILCNVLERVISEYGIWSRVGYPNMFQPNGKQIHLNIANDLLGITDYTQETPTTAKAKMNTWLSNNTVMVNRPLLTPFDIQLTPTQINTLIGNNTIFADTGDVDLTYKDLDLAKRGNFREVFKLPS